MNLLQDPWLPVIRKNGVKDKIAIHQLLDDYKSNPVMEIEAPRPDFKNAIYQLLIGIVQVAATPKDEEEWAELFEHPYKSDEFSKRILKYSNCFEIDSAGPAFMQDFDLHEGEKKPISALLIEAPGGKTVKDNQDHFVKYGTIKQIDAYWAAIALYTMQTFAPSGGVGHRVGLRGGGPLTTLVIPNYKTTFWRKMWCNIISKEYIPILAGDPNLTKMADIFPWMKPSKLSKTKGSELFSTEVHPFHHFFGMPRRMRLLFSRNEGTCDLSGMDSTSLVDSFKTKNYGNNYDGAWVHPLNAYGHDPKKPNEIPLSIKAQPGGVGYRHWLGLSLESDRVMSATIVKLAGESVHRKDLFKKKGIALWAAGFDMDNMKARCWYESTMPIYPLAPNEATGVTAFVGEIINQTKELSNSLRYAVKAAWFGRPKDAKGDISFLDISFWQNTEDSFYSILDRLVHNLDNDEVRNGLVDEWGSVIKNEAESLFDTNALAQQEDGLDMKRVVKARQGLGKGINKMIKELKKLKEVEV